MKKKVKKRIEILLKLSLYQVEFMRKSPYHVINETVSFANSKWGKEIGGFVNAVLRNHIRYGKNLVPPNLSIRYSFPEWLVKRWRNRFKDETEPLLSYLNNSPSFGIRVNKDKISVDEVIRHFRNKGLAIEEGRFLDYALYTKGIMPVIKDDLFKKKLIYIQDEASQLAVEALDVRENQLILDACCGYGTKTIQIVDRYKNPHRVIAIDRARNKVERVPACVFRVVGDIFTSPLKGEMFDSILLDAPCSSLGIIHKHPEIKWRISESDISRFSETQLCLLETLWGSLKHGGSLVYSVCSFEPEETVELIERFKSKRKVELEKPFPFCEDKFFTSIPHRTRMDGFFIAKLKKV